MIPKRYPSREESQESKKTSVTRKNPETSQNIYNPYRSRVEVLQLLSSSFEFHQPKWFGLPGRSWNLDTFTSGLWQVFPKQWGQQPLEALDMVWYAWVANGCKIVLAEIKIYILFAVKLKSLAKIALKSGFCNESQDMSVWIQE